MSWGLISEMSHIGIQTTDVQGSIWDATQLLGLRVTEEAGDTVYLSASDVHHELIYRESDSNGVDSIGLLAKDGDALNEIRKRVQDENLEILSNRAQNPGVEDGFSFVGPEDFVFEINVGRQADRAAQKGFGPDRYGHLNFHPKNSKAMMEFLSKVLDFRLSDIIGEDHAYFMRCNADHHGIAILPGKGTFHHHAWQTQSTTDLVALGDRLNRVGRHLIWGPVRHGAGHNVAAYYVEQSGAVVELYTDLEQIYDDNRPPIIWGKDDNWYNMWSDYRPMDFRDFGIPPVVKR